MHMIVIALENILDVLDEYEGELPAIERDKIASELGYAIHELRDHVDAFEQYEREKESD